MVLPIVWKLHILHMKWDKPADPTPSTMELLLVFIIIEPTYFTEILSKFNLAFVTFLADLKYIKTYIGRTTVHVFAMLGLARGRWCTWVWISPSPRTFQGVTTLPISESAIPNNGKVGNQVLCPHSRWFVSSFKLIFLMYLVSCGFFF